MKHFSVKDTTTGEIFSRHGDTDFHPITAEEWNKELLHCDMCCFAITQCGELVLLDEVGNWSDPPEGRFEIMEDE